MLAAAASRGDFDAGRTDEEDLTALLADKATPCSHVEWSHLVPLVLIDTDYEPYMPRPLMRIVVRMRQRALEGEMQPSFVRRQRDRFEPAI